MIFCLGGWGVFFRGGWRVFFCVLLRFFLRRVVFFRIFVLVLQFFAVAASAFPSASAVVAAFGFEALRGRFAQFVQAVPPAPAFPLSERVAAACAPFASAVCGGLGCSWFVGWSVACLCASSFGVAVASGGIPVGGRQLFLFS